jgi:gluconolactonase
MSWNFEQLDAPYGNVSEGPIWNGEYLLYTRIQQARIMKYDPATGLVTVFKEGTNHSNGLAYDQQGRIHACEGGDSEKIRRVVRYEADGSRTVICDHYEGKKLNIPNDVVIDSHNRVWFTDPFYENAAGPWSADRTHKELDHESVYRCDPQPDGTWKTARVTFDTTRPNGLLLSLDHRTLYVAQSGRTPQEKRQLRAYAMKDDGSLGTADVLHDFGPNRGIDGMRLDVDGNIVATAGWELGGPGPSIYVFSPSGEVKERHDFPSVRPTNCCFGGPDLETLFVTNMDGRLYQVRTGRRGLALPPLTRA